jgi:hypothetical protein
MNQATEHDDDYGLECTRSAMAELKWGQGGDIDSIHT